MHEAKYADWVVEGLLPLSSLQGHILDRALDSFEENDIFFRDINKCLAGFSVEISSKNDLIEFVMWGGNALFNHVMFSLVLLDKWYSNPRTKAVYQIHEVALKMYSLLPRLLYRYVWLERECKESPSFFVSDKGNGWFRDPLRASQDAINNMPPDLKSFPHRYFLMVESTCCCCVFLNDFNLVAACNVDCNCVDALLHQTDLDHTDECSEITDLSDRGDLMFDEPQTPTSPKIVKPVTYFIDGSKVVRSGGCRFDSSQPFVFYIYPVDEKDKMYLYQCAFEDPERAYKDFLSSRGEEVFDEGVSFLHVYCIIDDEVTVTRCPSIDFSSVTPYRFIIQNKFDQFAFNSNLKSPEFAYYNYVI